MFTQYRLHHYSLRGFIMSIITALQCHLYHDGLPRDEERVLCCLGDPLLLHRCALRKSHETDSQNRRDQITSDGRSKRSLSDLRSVHFIAFILNGRLNECWLHTCRACVITTWRLGLRFLLSPAITKCFVLRKLSCSV